ncbi:hypothetical protein VSVS05_04379 (plasmid) [Vibrio scophthalmi]|uniref:Uncharacterized protein n=1 Tax=Vibrio scophthalmi TaxID=45658 RepID=A0A1C7FJB6_9VIBR|nr:hypothetical protein VSVS05_04379 [Vibrio scophthalmi]
MRLEGKSLGDSKPDDSFRYITEELSRDIKKVQVDVVKSIAVMLIIHTVSIVSLIYVVQV